MAVDPLLQQNYDEYYGSGELAEWRALGAVDKADNIRSLCAAHPHSSVLEIGAGDGAVLQGLADSGFGQRHYALEISASGVERIRNRRIASLVECQQFDGYRVPYPDGAFDLAVLTHVVEHVEHPRLLINEAARVAQNTSSSRSRSSTIGACRRIMSGILVGHINFYTAQTIRLLVQSCGYEVLEQRQTHPARVLYTYRLGRKGARQSTC